MNIITLPFHHWRKILKEGFRTRDAHFIEGFENQKEVEKVVVINRPTTLLELVVKKFPRKIPGEILLKESGFTLIKVNEKVYVIDFVSKDILGQLFKKFRWFFEAFENPNYLRFIQKSLQFLEVERYYLVSQNILASTIIPHFSPQKSVFDAWDNFYKINSYSSIKEEIKAAYQSYATSVDFWVTNAKDNLKSFTKNYHPKSITLIPNGLDTSRFTVEKTYLTPPEFEKIKRPIIGFGGKITQTIDVELLNYAISQHPEYSFVVMGQILDKEIFNSIQKKDHFYYLGDIHYDRYPDYVAQFDICLVPYHISEGKKSGANPIKVYEYLSLHKKVIGTHGNGLEDLSDYLYLIDSKEALSAELKNGVENTMLKIAPETFSWNTKVSELLTLLKS